MADTRQFLFDNFIFVSGRVVNRDELIFLAHYQPALDQGISLAQVFYCNDENRWREAGRMKWEAVDLVVPRSGGDRIIVLGRDGDVGVIGSSGINEENLNPQRAVGPTRGVVEIDHDVLAFGMKREVFRRDAQGEWSLWNKGMEATQAKPDSGMSIADAIKARIKDLGGINAIVGKSLNEVYAFGMRGEIWRSTGSHWSPVDSPTNLALSDATLFDDELIYACGQTGIIVKGYEDQWEVVSYEGVEGLDFSSIASFEGRIYVADGHSLRILEERTLEVVDFGVGDIVPSSMLHVNDGVLLSIAGKEIFVTRDGVSWTSLLT